MSLGRISLLLLLICGSVIFAKPEAAAEPEQVAITVPSAVMAITGPTRAPKVTSAPAVTEAVVITEAPEELLPTEAPVAEAITEESPPPEEAPTAESPAEEAATETAPAGEAPTDEPPREDHRPEEAPVESATHAAPEEDTTTLEVTDHAYVPHHVEHTKPIHEPPSSPMDELPPKISHQATFIFSTEERCFNFLKRLRGKGRNEHSDHPLTCGAAFDGILCWRPADPGETIRQVCPDGPSNLKNYVKRECVNGQWRDYHDHVNARLKLRGVSKSNYEECYQVPGFVKKHGDERLHEQLQLQSHPRQRPNSAEMRGPAPAVTEYAARQDAQEMPTTVNSLHYVPRPDDSPPTTTLSVHHDFHATDLDESKLPPRPWIVVDDGECQDLLSKHGLSYDRNGAWCPGTTDEFYLCWPATAPNKHVSQPCSVGTQHASRTRRCGPDGKWDGTKTDGTVVDETRFRGWTNNEACTNLGAAVAVVESATSASTEHSSAEPVPAESVSAEPQGAVHISGFGLHMQETSTVADMATSTILAVVEDASSGSSMALTSDLGTRHETKQPWLWSSQEGCAQFLKDIARFEKKQSDNCPGDSDGHICWPPTPKDFTENQPCPKIVGFNEAKSVSRTCGSNGVWTGPGNYQNCFTTDLSEYIKSQYQQQQMPCKSTGNNIRFWSWSIVVSLLLALHF